MASIELPILKVPKVYASFGERSKGANKERIVDMLIRHCRIAAIVAGRAHLHLITRPTVPTKLQEMLRNRAVPLPGGVDLDLLEVLEEKMVANQESRQKVGKEPSSLEVENNSILLQSSKVNQQ